MDPFIHSNLSQLLPIEEAETLPAQLYTQELWHQWDLKNVLERAWQLVGPRPQVGHLDVIDLNGNSVIVLVEPNGELQAFHNVCRHRAGPLATEAGPAKALRCRYHGWTYDLNGNLIRAPEMPKKTLDKCAFSLKPVEKFAWHAVLFLSHAEKEPLPYLGQIEDMIQPIDLSHFRFAQRVHYDLNCNWKVYMDNFLEGYHLPYVHPGLSKLLDYRSYKTELYDGFSYQYSPLDTSSGFYGEGKAHYFTLYPNMMLNILPNRMQTNLVVPLSPNRCRVLFDYYYANLEEAAVASLMKQDVEFSEEVQQEDITICEHVQAGLQSGSYQTGRFCPKRETGVHHFHDWIRQKYRAQTQN